jgi:DNA-binding GntR family transcriptional regulator
MITAVELQAKGFVARAEALAELGPLAPPTLPGHIAAWMADRIQFGDLKPGEPIRELAVADHFDVSRGPVREALRLLDRDGLVTLNGRKGARVRAFSAEETDAVFRIRAEIFGEMTGLAAAAEDRDPAALAMLEEGGELLTALAEDAKAPIADYMVVRRSISRLIVRLGRNTYLAQVSGGLEREIAVLWASVLSPERRRRSAASWVKLCGAIVKADAAEARRLGNALVMEGLAEIQRQSASG